MVKIWIPADYDIHYSQLQNTVYSQKYTKFFLQILFLNLNSNIYQCESHSVNYKYNETYIFNHSPTLQFEVRIQFLVKCESRHESSSKALNSNLLLCSTINVARNI